VEIEGYADYVRMHGECVLGVSRVVRGSGTQAKEERGGEDDGERSNLCHEKEGDNTPTKHNLLGRWALHCQKE
jgi:hypothetical protein